MSTMRRRWTAIACLAIVIAAGAFVFLRPISVFDGFAELKMLFNGAHSRFTTVNGIRVHYYVMGPKDGPPVVLVHGLGGRAEDWRNLAPYLKKAGYRIYVPDLPGYGQSERPGDFSYSIPDEAEVVVGFFDKLDLQRVDLIGWSMGGWIVQWVAARHPERVKKLMVLDSAGIRARPTWNTALFTPTTADELARLDDLLMPNPPHLPAFIARDVLRVSREHAWVIQKALRSMLTGDDVTDTMLPEMKMPILIVWGSEDHITPLSEGNEMKRLAPHAELDVIGGCGHLAPVQCSREIAPAMVGFLNRQ
ncbi:MAG TPA: alpha/beta hydrolase [Terracidiphilus sp.]|nr:alpha/beta hydrolase [Terracidiphilus sp.]